MSLPPAKAGRVDCVAKVLLVFLHRSPLGLVEPPPNLSFLVCMVSRQIATVGQLYVLATVPIGKTMALFGAGSIVFANVFGVLLLADVLSTRSYAGIALAVLAFMVMGLGK